MFKIKIILFISIFLFVNSLSASANIAYINFDFLLSNSKAGKNIESEIKKLQKKQFTEFKNKEDNLKNNEDKLLSKKNILEKKAYILEVEEFKKEVVIYNKYKNDKITSLNKRRTKSINIFMREVTPILTEYVAKNNISILLEKKNIVIGKSNLDITKTILVLLDEKIDKINID